MKILDRKADKEDMLKIEERFIKEIRDINRINEMYPEPSELAQRLD